MQTINIEGTIRTGKGKTAAKQIRRNNEVPCVLYGGEENVHFSLHTNSFKELVYSPLRYKVMLNIEGKEYEALLKEVQFHPTTDSIEHADFQQLIAGKAVTTTLPVKLVGLAEGVKAGGKLVTKVRRLGVKVLPENLIQEVIVNVDSLEIGKSIRVRDIEAEGVEILNPPSIPVASVIIPRAARSAAAEEEAAAAEGEAAGEDGGEETTEE